MERIRSALFLDFDNIYGGMFAIDKNKAYALADNPGRFLEVLSTYGLPVGERRDLLVLRAYFNPTGRISDPDRGNEQGSHYLATAYRPNFTLSGFEVVDCPPLTRRHKNAVDIRITVDVLQSLHANTHYDEIIIASSDADFTPLLLHLRASDRRTMIISAGAIASAYRNIASVHLDAQGLIEILENSQTGSGAVVDANPTVAIDNDLARMREQVQQATEAHIAESDEPILLAMLGSNLRDEYGYRIGDDWFGTNSLSAFLHQMNAMSGIDIRIDGKYVWDADRHLAPNDGTPPPPVTLPPRIAHICHITDLPRLSSGSWQQVFGILTKYAQAHTFNLTECTT